MELTSQYQCKGRDGGGREQLQQKYRSCIGGVDLIKITPNIDRWKKAANSYHQ